jgi:hypothetical protein
MKVLQGISAGPSLTERLANPPAGERSLTERIFQNLVDSGEDPVRAYDMVANSYPELVALTPTFTRPGAAPPVIATRQPMTMPKPVGLVSAVDKTLSAAQAFVNKTVEAVKSPTFIKQGGGGAANKGLGYDVLSSAPKQPGYTGQTTINGVTFNQPTTNLNTSPQQPKTFDIPRPTLGPPAPPTQGSWGSFLRAPTAPQNGWSQAPVMRGEGTPYR